ncbi:DUF433 domain-containing protein [Halobacteriales archaeon QS_7_69_60]|nr:MAG: DUF433 domain-containing protein [Halobacteriales archaeon QS_7_69_60]
MVFEEGVLDGEPRIEGHRIGVLQVHAEVEEGDVLPRAFADRYGLEVAAVYRALAYYHEYPAEMEVVRERRRERVESARDDIINPEDIR